MIENFSRAQFSFHFKTVALTHAFFILCIDFNNRYGYFLIW